MSNPLVLERARKIRADMRDQGRSGIVSRNPQGLAERNRALAVGWFERIWNERREQAVDELMHPEALGHFEGTGIVTREEFKAARRALLGAISDLSVELLDVVAEGETTVIRWRIRGTHDGIGLGIAPSGKPIEQTGVSWLMWEDGLMIGGWDSWNHGAMLAEMMKVRVGEVQERHGLTRRQAEVALLMADRQTHKEIAKRLEVAPNTARRHCQDVLQRLGVHRREDVAHLLRGADERT